MGCNCGGNLVDLKKKGINNLNTNKLSKNNKDNKDKKNIKNNKDKLPDISLFKKLFG
jgi:hypothetical protein